MRAVTGWIFWIATFFLVAASPLPLGAVNTWWSMPLALAALLLAILAILVPALARGSRVRIPLRLLPLGLFSFVVLLQLVPLPGWLISVLSPARAALPALPGNPGAASLSVYPGGTLETGILHLGLAYLVWAVSLRRARAAFAVLGVAATLHALFALILSEAGGTSSTRVLWIYSLPEVLTPFGTFVNKNHFATLMVIGAGANLAVLVSVLRAAREDVAGGELRVQISRLTAGGFAAVLPWGLGLLVCMLAVFASGSRGGALALVAGLLGATVAAGIASRRIRKWPVVLLVLLVAGSAFAAEAGSSQSVLERLVPAGRYMNRPRLWKDSLRAALDYPLVGTGLGTFPYAFPRYQTFDPAREFTHAEGDWVQYLVETGVAGSLCLAAFAGLLLFLLWRRMKAADEGAALAIGGAAALVGLIVHGFLDSGIHIPSNLLAGSVLFGAILSMGGPGGIESELRRGPGSGAEE